MHKHLATASIVLFAFLCAAGAFWVFGRQPKEQLFFALQIEEEGLVVARPKLLGEAGRTVSVRMVDPSNPSQTRLAVELEPVKRGDTYSVQLDVALGDSGQHAQGSVKLHHAEERTVLLPGGEKPVSVQLLVMRVGSPEFKAYMELARKDLAKSAS